MTTSEQENTTKDPSGVRVQKKNGIAGPSHEVSKRDQTVSCTAGVTGQEISELKWARRHIKDEPTVRLVTRKTEIIGCGMPRRKKRSLTLREKAESISIDLSPEMRENNGDLIFVLLDHMHRIAERQDKKIERLQDRLSEMEEQGGLR